MPLARQLLIPAHRLFETLVPRFAAMKECVLVKEVINGAVLVNTGTRSFSSRLVDDGLISRHDVAVAELHAKW